jgi:2-C-methyl-D-erythritol 2,4-cyclodiphosphate synthase
VSDRAGIGFDVHPFDASRPLVLGGVTLEGPGLRGHSDADVLAHAIADALLGAAALGDLGSHFPDTDPRWRGASSMDLLERVAAKVRDAGYEVASVDATVLMEAPRLAPFVNAMRRNIAAAIALDVSQVSVKATRMEGLGTVGRGEGAACMAIALLRARA